MGESKYTMLIEAEADTKGIGKLQKELNTLYKEQKKASSTAAGALVKQQAKTKELNKLTGPTAQRQQLASKKEELRLDKQMTEEIKKQTIARRKLLEANKLAQRTTFGGGFGRAMGFRQAGDPNAPNWRSRMGAAAGGALRTGIGMAGGGLTALAMAPIMAMGTQYQQYQTYQRSLTGLSGMHQGSPFGGPRGMTQDSLHSLLAHGAPLGYSLADSVQAAQGMGRAVGAGGAVGGAGYAMSASRATGLDMSTITDMFAEQRRGAGSFGGTQSREFSRMLQAAITAGMDASTMPEAMAGIQQLLQGANTRGGATSGLPYMQLLAMMGSSHIAGLQGARGAAIAGSMENRVVGAGTASGGGPGDHDAINMMMLQQAGYGNGASLFEARRRLDLGFQNGGIGVQGYSNVIGNLRSSMGNEAARDTMASDMGISQNAMQDIFDMIDQGADTATIQERLTHATEGELDVLRSIDDNILDFLHGAARSAGHELENLDNGTALSDPLEALEDIMRQFINSMVPILNEVLPALPPLLNTVTTAVAGLVHAIDSTLFHPENISEAVQQEFSAFSQIDAETTAGLRAASGLTDESSATAIQAARDQLQHANDLLGTQMEDTNVAISRFVRGESGHDQDLELRREQAIDRLNALLTQMAARQEPASAAAAAPVMDTRPLTPYLDALTPPTPRSTTSSTGGAP